MLRLIVDYLPNQTLRALACTNQQFHSDLVLIAKQSVVVNPLSIWYRLRTEVEIIAKVSNQITRIKVRDKAIVIGRSTKSVACDVNVEIPSVSRKHIILQNQDGVLTCDILGTHQTLLNGTRA